jgi:hypothetical protein
MRTKPAPKLPKGPVVDKECPSLWNRFVLCYEPLIWLACLSGDVALFLAIQQYGDARNERLPLRNSRANAKVDQDLGMLSGSRSFHHEPDRKPADILPDDDWTG